jgi:uncharacterized protein YyaL (SSP411 family)
MRRATHLARVTYLTPIAAAAFLAALVAMPLIASAEGITWVDKLDKAFEDAAKEDKIILVDFMADWCAPCKRMDREVYTEAAVITALKDVICVKIDVDHAPDLQGRYFIKLLPTVLFFNADGIVLTKAKSAGDGFVNSSSLIDANNYAPRRRDEFKRTRDDYTAKIDAEKDDTKKATLMAGLAKEYWKNSGYKNAIKYAKLAVETDGKGDKAGVRGAMVSIVVQAHYYMTEYDTCIELAKKYLEQFSSDGSAGDWVLHQAKAMVQSGKKGDAKTLLQAALKTYKGTKYESSLSKLLQQID